MSIKNTYRYTQVSKELAAAKHDLSLKKQRLNHLQTRLDMVSSNTSIEVAIKSRLGYIHKGEHVFRLSQRK